MDYRSADLIELHEPGIRLIVDSARDVVGVGFTDDSGTFFMGKSFVLRGDTLANLSKIFGIDTNYISRTYFNTKKQKEVTYHKNLEETDFPIDIEYQDPFEHNNIKFRRLFVKEMENHIEIKIVMDSLDSEAMQEDGSKKYDEIVREISYRGTYTIWWTPPE